MTLACRAGNPGSTPGVGVLLLKLQIYKYYLCNFSMEKIKKVDLKEGFSDTLGLFTYSFLTGIATDYASGLRGIGIIASRIYGGTINFPTATFYGKWRNFLYKKTKTTDKSSKKRKYGVELLAFDTFQVPLYATVLSVGSLTSNLSKGEFRIDFEKVKDGVEILTLVSPLIGPTCGLYMEGLRKLFEIDSAPKKARKNLENNL